MNYLNYKTYPEKKQDIVNATLNYIKKLKTISICGNFADKELLDYVK